MTDIKEQMREAISIIEPRVPTPLVNVDQAIDKTAEVAERYRIEGQIEAYRDAVKTCNDSDYKGLVWLKVRELESRLSQLKGNTNGNS